MKIKGNIVDSQIDYLEQINTNLKNIFEDLKGQSQSIKDNWTGFAANEYTSKYDKLCQSFDSYNEVLEELTNYVRNMMDSATTVEENNISRVTNLFFE